jgi:hypothetical protein
VGVSCGALTTEQEAAALLLETEAQANTVQQQNLFAQVNSDGAAQVTTVLVLHRYRHLFNAQVGTTGKYCIFSAYYVFRPQDMPLSQKLTQ